MSTAGSLDASLEIFGGLVTDMAPADLPHGVSPDCQDVVFSEGGVRTRPGLQPVFAPLAGNPTVNYLKTYVTLNGTPRTLVMDSSGALYKETSPGFFAAVASGLAPGSYANSATLFGREYVAISDGRAGNDLPRQFDDTNFDRVSQSGPAGAPTAADENVSFAIAASPNGATESGSTVTIQTTAAHSFVVGQLVAISGVGAAGYNGTFTVASVPDSTHFTYVNTATGLSASGGGTAAAAGNIPAGVHKVAVIFKTRQGYLTAPGPSASWTAAGSKRVVVSNIPIGPANVVARILCFTGAGGASFFYVDGGAALFSGNMVIADNTTTSVTIDFSDAILLAGANVDDLAKLVELGACAGVIDYAQRLFWWGERNKMNNWVNLGFDGGFTGPNFPHFPLGWTPDPTFSPGGTDEQSNVVWGAAYSIVGNGATPTRGLITQSAVADSLGVPLIRPNTEYTIRARCARNALLTQGTLHIHLYSATAGINTTGLQLTATQLSTAYAEFAAQLTAPLATIPADLVLRVYADGTPTQNGAFFIDNMEIAPALEPVNGSLVRASRVQDPESYDGVNGLLSVAENNGQAIRAAFKLRERLYFVKEHSLYVTQDDGTNEPALWTISEVSRRVGTPSVRGVAVAEDWAVMAHRSGLYIFWGAEPVKISQEIQPLWNQINWQYGHTIWIAIDTKERRILIGAPFGSATSPNKILMLDYRDLDSGEAIASRPPIHVTFAGRKTAFDKTRKWSPWAIAANAGALIERADGTTTLMLGGGSPGVGGGGPAGKVYQLSDTQLSDDGTAIQSYYTTHFFPERAVEQQLDLGAHRKLFTYLTMYVEGSGALGLTAFVNHSAAPQAQQPLALSSPSLKDLELPINVAGERVAFKVATGAAGSWFRLQKFTPSLRPDPWAPVRGVN
jgi:hypothetical protein